MTSGMFGRPRGEYFMRFRGALPVSSFLALLVCLGMAGSANAQTTVWVDDCPTPGPAPGTAGTQGNPYCSIQTAICSIKANGGTVNVLPGTYNETLRFPANVNVISTDGPVTTILNAANKSCVTSDFCTLAATTNCSALYSSVTTAVQSTSLGDHVYVQGTISEGWYCINSAKALEYVAPVGSKPADCTSVHNDTGSPGLYLAVHATYLYQPIFPGLTIAETFQGNINRTAWMRLL